jgi:hypothetical protein
MGALTGFALSIIYGGLILAALLLMMTLRAPGTPAEDYVVQLVMASATAGFALPCIGILGVCPGVLWGALLGLLVSLPISLLHRRLRPLSSALIGAALAAALTALWPLLFCFPTSSGIELRTYFLWQGAPGLLSIPGGALVGWWLCRSTQRVTKIHKSLEENTA